MNKKPILKIHDKNTGLNPLGSTNESKGYGKAP